MVGAGRVGMQAPCARGRLATFRRRAHLDAIRARESGHARRAAELLVAERHLLEEDVELVVARAGASWDAVVEAPSLP